MDENDELHQRTVEVLVKLVDVLDCDELSLICWHCGVQPNDLMPSMPLYVNTKLNKERSHECTL